jgi:large subunit ribosomal protein L29
MKIKDIRELSLNELSARKRELKQEVFHLRIQQASGQLEKPSQITALRKEVARIETVLTQKSNAATATK